MKLKAKKDWCFFVLFCFVFLSKVVITRQTSNIFILSVKSFPVITHKVPGHSPCSRVRGQVRYYHEGVLWTDFVLIQWIVKTPRCRETNQDKFEMKREKKDSCNKNREINLRFEIIRNSSEPEIALTTLIEFPISTTLSPPHTHTHQALLPKKIYKWKRE